MRIAHVIHAFPPFSRAGCENYVEALAREQLRRHEVVVFHRVSDPERPEYEVSEGRAGEIPVVRVNRTFRDMKSFRDTYRSDAVAAAFGAFLERFRPDAVHFHHTTCLSTTCVHEAHRRGIPVVYTLHDFWLLCPRGQLVRRDLSLCERHTDADCVRCMAWQLRVRGGHARVRALFERASRLARLRLPKELYRRFASRPFAREDEALGEIRERTAHVLETCALVDRFVSPSRFAKARHVEFGVDADKITVADNGFDLSRARREVPAPRAASEPLRVAYLGTWIPTKGVHVLVEAFREIDPEVARLDVHGYAPPYDGFDDYEGHLRRLAGGAQHVRFHGAYAPEDVPALLAQADVLVVPSIWYENSPLTLHEARIAGVPVVASAHGGLLELVEHEVDGLVFQPGSAAALRVALERLAGDRALLERLRLCIPPVQEIGGHARELEAIYRGLGVREEIAADASREDAGTLPRGSGEGGSGEAMPARDRLELLNDLFARPIENVSQSVAPEDEMFAGNREHYFGVGDSALRCIELALLAAQKSPRDVKRILDLPCGHGRVLRTLRAAFPGASLTACDLSRHAIDHCAKAFGAEPVHSSEDPKAIPLSGRFDLIWCGSLLTHLDEPRWSDFLDLFVDALEAGGLLLFTVHGRAIFERIRNGWDYGLGTEALAELAAQYQRRGFGFVDYPERRGYGISVAARSWVVALLERHPALRLLAYSERGWDDHQDTVACVKDVWRAPPGPARSKHARLDFGI